MKLRTSLTLGMILLPMAAHALPNMVKDFQTAAKPKPGSPLAKAGCSACHVGSTPALNPYGKDLGKALKGSPKVTPAAVAKVASLDSDKDGAKNNAEIKAGTLPGSKTSKPGKK